MVKRVLIDAVHGEEIRIIVEKDGKVIDYDVQSTSKTQNRGNIYVGKINRIEPSLQAAFVEYGSNRNGFLPMSEVNPMFYAKLSEKDKEAVSEEYNLSRASKYNFIGKVREMLSMAENGHVFPHVEDEEDSKKESRPKPKGKKKGQVKAYRSKKASESKESNNRDKLNGEKPKQNREQAKPNQNTKPETKQEKETVSDSVVSTTVIKASNDEPKKMDVLKINIPEQDVSKEDSKEVKVEKTTIALEDKGDITEALDENLELVNSKSDVDFKCIRLKTKTNEEQIEELKGYLQPLNRRYNIEDVLEEGQKILVQVNKEERGNKGAALTSNISLPGRYSVLMPNVPNSGGVSRKITDPMERSELRSIIDELNVEQRESLIIRTAAIGQDKQSIERDFLALKEQWDNIIKVMEKENAPVCVHNDSNIITKSIRDIVSGDVDEIVVSGEDAYKEAKNYVRTIMPSFSKKIREHRAQLPVFSHYKVETELHKLHTTRVDLESGAYLIINPTEALVSIDINSGKSTGEKNIEETALKTNIEAAHEIAKQLRLRDLSGLIVIDFIDMDSQDNERQVERALRNALRHDRARTQVGFMSEFGLLEMSRQRIRPTLEESMFKICPHCIGTGRMRSPSSSAITILRGIEEEKLYSKAEIIEIHTHSDVAVYMLNHKRALISEFETKYKVRIIVTADDNYMAPDYRVDLIRVSVDGSTKRTTHEFFLREKAEKLNQIDEEIIGNLVKTNQIKTVDTRVIPTMSEDDLDTEEEVNSPRKAKSRPHKRNYNKKSDTPTSQKTKEMFKRWWSGR